MQLCKISLIRAKIIPIKQFVFKINLLVHSPKKIVLIHNFLLSFLSSLQSVRIIQLPHGYPIGAHCSRGSRGWRVVAAGGSRWIFRGFDVGVVGCGGGDERQIYDISSTASSPVQLVGVVAVIVKAHGLRWQECEYVDLFHWFYLWVCAREHLPTAFVVVISVRHSHLWMWASLLQS